MFHVTNAATVIIMSRKRTITYPPSAPSAPASLMRRKNSAWFSLMRRRRAGFCFPNSWSIGCRDLTTKDVRIKAAVRILWSSLKPDIAAASPLLRLWTLVKWWYLQNLWVGLHHGPQSLKLPSWTTWMTSAWNLTQEILGHSCWYYDTIRRLLRMAT